MDFSAIAAYDTGTIITGLLAIGGVLAGVKWGKYGVRAVVGMIGRG